MLSLEESRKFSGRPSNLEIVPSDEIATVALSNLATLRGLLHSVRNDKPAYAYPHADRPGTFLTKTRGSLSIYYLPLVPNIFRLKERGNVPFLPRNSS